MTTSKSRSVKDCEAPTCRCRFSPRPAAQLVLTSVRQDGERSSSHRSTSLLLELVSNFLLYFQFWDSGCLLRQPFHFSWKRTSWLCCVFRRVPSVCIVSVDWKGLFLAVSKNSRSSSCIEILHTLPHTEASRLGKINCLSKSCGTLPRSTVSALHHVHFTPV